MTVISDIQIGTADLPFRFSFGHALADRRSSTNVFVRITLDSGAEGFGEGVPRDYVTGETVDDALAVLGDRFAPALLGASFSNPDDVPVVLDSVARSHAPGPGEAPHPAAWCAIELAALDACGHHFGCSVDRWLSAQRAPHVWYDAIIPFSSPGRLAVLAVLIRLLGFKHVKIKVGDDLGRDLRALGMLRRVLGPAADLRVDANCAWNVDQALEAIEQMRRFRISAVEQPLPADDLDGLRRLTASCPEMIIVDESLRTLEEAVTLAETRACDAFNIRISKCGGLLSSARVARVAAESGLACVVGAQVGESGILSAAGRHFAASLPGVRYVEGSAGRLLLKEDLTVENVLPGWGGRGRSFTGPGLGVHVNEAMWRKCVRVHRTLRPLSPTAGITP
jgi:muconate cycloisomerase